ncbi:MAG: Asp-tRNA(Asn)/Glu-tRNA(Gln) amidotransferase subunit GatC [Patescibacteria group bacterium]
MITLETIEKLAQLSRLALSDSEKEVFRKEIESILGYVEQIKNAPTSETSPLSPLSNVMREDVNPHETGVFTKDIVGEFPEKEGNYLKVKNIL